jgi:beta-lactamase regulating signal transducer with metallopeptidase domain/protocatechuate 3,4-dioxygenase beta subunit
MSDAIARSVLLWLADVYLLSTLLLAIVLGLLFAIRQPSRRMTVARAAVLGLVLLPVITAMPRWPRHSWAVVGFDQIGSSGTQGLAGPVLSPDSDARVNLGPTRRADQNPTPAEGKGAALHPEGRSTVAPRLGFAVDSSQHLDRSAPLPLASLILAAYVTGAVLALGWLVVGAVQTASLRRHAFEAPERLRRLLRQACAADDRLPELGASTRITQPVAMGILRPTILFPATFSTREPEAGLERALAHELAHIRNGDLRLLVLCRLLLPVFYSQPLFWIVRRSIRLDQEVLADAEAARTDRTAYAETLLDWARAATRPSGSVAAVLGFWERPTHLHRRVALLLDPTLSIEQRAPRRWRWTIPCAAVSLVLGLSLFSIRPSAFDAQTGQDPAARDPAASSRGEVVFQGRVLDPDGKPFAGAAISLGNYWETDDGKQAAIRATSGLDGRFRFVVEKSYFERTANREIEPWNDVRLVAVAPGFGLGLADSKEPDANRDVTLRLVRDDVPISGRVLDPEGRPVSDALLRVWSVKAAPDGSLDPWLRAVQEGKEPGYVLDQRHLPVQVYLGDKDARIPPSRTDREGRFRIVGVGRDRLAELKLDGPSVQAGFSTVMTRRGEAIRLRDNPPSSSTSFVTYHGATLALTAAPGRNVEGTVRSLETGEAVAGALVTGLNRRAGGNIRVLRTRTDPSGHFRIEGLPIEPGGDVAVFPKESPYLGTLMKLADRPAGEVIHLDMRLRRGIVVHGKVTDKASGKPVRAIVRYTPVADNPEIGRTPGYREVAAEGSYTTAADTKADGSFRIPVLPGRGLLIVGDAGWRYPGLDKLEWAKFRSISTLPSQGDVQAYRQITVEQGSPPGPLEFSLDAGVSVAGTVVDQEGKPAAGTLIFGEVPQGGWATHARSAEFTLYGLRPGPPRSLSSLMELRSPEMLTTFIQRESPRTIVLIHEDRHLATALPVRSTDKGPVHARLAPTATLVGRFVTPEGQPVPDAGFQIYYLGFDLLDDFIYFPQFVRTSDSQGKFRIENVAPGLRIRILPTNGKGIARQKELTLPPLKPGVVRDLGDVMFFGGVQAN